MSRLKNKVCVITGAGGGMGAEAAQVFTDEGAKVALQPISAPHEKARPSAACGHEVTRFING